MGVEAAARDQLSVVTGLDDPAFVEHDERIGVAHRRQPVGDDDGRAVVHQVLKRPAHEPLVDRVEMRGRLVENQHRRILEEGAGDGDALALATR